MIRYNKIWFQFVLLILFAVNDITSQQLNINRIEQMPNIPSPYIMRDWKNVAVGYDSFVFDFNLAGDYLPLGQIVTNTTNYPAHNSFTLHTVVGTPYPNSGEAINCLPAVIGATLVGIDKSSQNGNNWVLMCEEWFNNRPEQNVYKNHPADDNYDDWWYSTMPNVFFYQLYDLYPNTGDFSYQFTSVADQWLKSVVVMGGKSTPWKKSYMNYRGFDLRTMTPYDADPAEPEAAGAIAWLLYNAYSETKNEEYRIGAEWAMEFLNEWPTNPSYELQLSYGAYTAARMNAELGTNYDINKILNWCFDVGPLREWGAITGTWGTRDVDGLIGEVNGSNDYAFSMNTFEQIGALLPLVRYDDRYSRAIGKWILNAANALRLFYPNYLPDFQQDSEEWARSYDPDSYIAHEAMREQGPGGWSPYATGDAISGGWGATNLTLYSSSHVGILGGVLDTTNVEGILMLDLLKTDYFHSDAYPSYLIYNPYSEQKFITISLPAGTYDLYDAVGNEFITSGSSGSADISIQGESAMQIVEVPTGMEISYILNTTLAGGIIIDYNSGINVENYPPRIKSLSPDKDPVLAGDTVKVYCTAVDPDSDSLTYSWTFPDTVMPGGNKTESWTTPDDPGDYPVHIIVNDGKNGADTTQIIIRVVEAINHSPQIEGLNALPRKIDLGGLSEIECLAYDEDGDELSYHWSAGEGSIEGTGEKINWTAPLSQGNYYIKCIVDDGRGGQAEDSIGIVVRDFSDVQSGNLILHLPFDGNADDVSGNSHHGTVYGASLTSDRNGNSGSAYKFDGTDDYILVANSPDINFTDAITVNFWMKVEEFFDREAYPISHGNWENRWKASITQRGLRWTVKSTDGIKDLDSETLLPLNEFINVTLYYRPNDFELYLNGELNAFTGFTGNILTTTHGLTIGQVLPGNNNYNFKGVLDDIRIYDYGLSVREIENLYNYGTRTEEGDLNDIPELTYLFQNYPNPFNNQTVIKFSVNENSYVKLSVFDILGREIKSLVKENKNPGVYETHWNASDNEGKVVASGIYFIRLDTIKFTDTKKIMLLQ